MADLTVVARALEEHRAAKGQYPVTMNTDELAGVLLQSPGRIVPTWGVSYFSDGHHYTLQWRITGLGAYERQACFLEVRDGRWSSWPSFVTDEYIYRYEARIRGDVESRAR